jgi:hypothetical protein
MVPDIQEYIGDCFDLACSDVTECLGPVNLSLETPQ